MISKNETEIIKNWQGDIDEPIVSIKCATFNQEEYISNALDSFLAQETTFPFEIVIHDDASTDNTAKIIKEYESKYPNIVKPIYEVENQYSKQDDSLTKIINSKLKGKYIALCEGDDFWVDKKKLQKQYNALQKNKNCNMCVHKTRVTKEDGSTFLYEYPNAIFKEGIVNRDLLFNNFDKYNFHTSSYFMTRESFDAFYKNPYVFRIEGSKAKVGDAPLLFYYGYYGYIYYIDECMSTYRSFSNSSWTKRNIKSNKTYINTAKHIISMMENIDETSKHKYHEACKRIIDFYNFGIYYRKNMYKELIKKEYRDILYKFPFYKRIMIYIGCVSPSTTNIVKKIYYTHKRKKIVNN